MYRPADMEAHMKDLQEVTESTTASLVRAEEKLKHLEEENRELKARNSGHFDMQVLLQSSLSVICCNYLVQLLVNYLLLNTLNSQHSSKLSDVILCQYYLMNVIC